MALSAPLCDVQMIVSPGVRMSAALQETLTGKRVANHCLLTRQDPCLSPQTKVLLGPYEPSSADQHVLVSDCTLVILVSCFCETIAPLSKNLRPE